MRFLTHYLKNCHNIIKAKYGKTLICFLKRLITLITFANITCRCSLKFNRKSRTVPICFCKGDCLTGYY